ncbi:glycosyltransferase family 4 protein [Bifidobacterium catenulatum]|uniref:glycosyltransferase family 4 protein n=1 Tax=Bifidobacterium catenulatum TaxID=1686 RepID=UPI001182E0AB|nr:glycosyltransferase family 4 protein [Bifidobacterium catenulatum]
MNILFIENAGNRNAGAFHSMIALIKLLKEYGVESFVALPDKADGKQLLIDNDIHFIELRACSYSWMIPKEASLLERLKMPFKDFVVKIFSFKLARYIKENHIQIVHENTSACYIGFFAAKIARVKHIWHIREFMEEDFNNRIWWKRRATCMMNHADAVIAISDAIEKKYKKILTGNNIYKIYNGIVVNDFLNKDKNILIKPVVQLLCVGRVCEGKGQKKLIKALGELKKINITPHVTFAGSFSKDIYKEYRDLAKRLNVEDQIVFLGQVDDMNELYKASDIFCMCSNCEAFGRVTVEAMLAGNLIIGANSGGTPEILGNGEYGLLFESNSYKDLACKIQYAIENSSQMRNLAVEGREHAVKYFDAKLNAEKIYSLYRSILIS